MGRRLSLAVVAAAAVLGASGFALVHPSDPHPPGSDLYTHLGIARHLARGEGFLNDCVYPFSLAFPFAARVPQPVLHRPPAAPLLFVLPCWAGHGDPEATLTAVRPLWIGLLALICALGAAAALRRGHGAILLPWLATLIVNPLSRSAINWGQIEVPSAAILMALWIRWPRGLSPTERRPRSTALLVGVLAGALTLLRTELCWVPWLWWLLARPRPPGRLLLFVALGQVLVCAPWAARNLAVTGNPFFNLQFYGLDWQTYRSLTPEPLIQILAHEPDRILAKFRAGLAFYGERPQRWLPWPLWLVAGLHLLRELSRRRTQPPTAGPGPESPASGQSGDAWRLPLLLLTLALLTVQYAALSHELRFMFPVLPIVSLEIWAALDAHVRVRQQPAIGRPSGVTSRPAGTADWTRALLLAGLGAALLWLAPPQVPGLAKERDAAAAAAPLLVRAVAETSLLPPGPVFTDTSALVWLTGRPGVWRPWSADVEVEIRRRLPEMREAACVYVLGEPAGADR